MGRWEPSSVTYATHRKTVPPLLRHLLCPETDSLDLCPTLFKGFIDPFGAASASCLSIEEFSANMFEFIGKISAMFADSEHRGHKREPTPPPPESLNAAAPEH